MIASGSAPVNLVWRLGTRRLKISVLFVAHDIDEAIFLSDRVYRMTARPGAIRAEITIPLNGVDLHGHSLADVL